MTTRCLAVTGGVVVVNAAE